MDVYADFRRNESVKLPFQSKGQILSDLVLTVTYTPDPQWTLGIWPDPLTDTLRHQVCTSFSADSSIR